MESGILRNFRDREDTRAQGPISKNTVKAKKKKLPVGFCQVTLEIIQKFQLSTPGGSEVTLQPTRFNKN